MCTLLKHLLQIMAANRTRKNSRRQLSFTGTSRNVGVGRSCNLCHTHHHQLSTPAEWMNEEARKFVVSLHVQSDALICKRCKDDVTRVLANPSHIPRWRKGGVTGKDKCCITLCSESVFAHPDRTIRRCCALRLGFVEELTTRRDSPVPYLPVHI